MKPTLTPVEANQGEPVMAKRAKRMKPWEGWAIVDNDGGWHSGLYRTRQEAGLDYFKDATLRVVRVECRELPPRRKAKRKAGKKR